LFLFLSLYSFSTFADHSAIHCIAQVANFSDLCWIIFVWKLKKIMCRLRLFTSAPWHWLPVFSTLQSTRTWKHERKFWVFWPMKSKHNPHIVLNAVFWLSPDLMNTVKNNFRDNVIFLPTHYCRERFGERKVVGGHSVGR